MRKLAAIFILPVIISAQTLDDYRSFITESEGYRSKPYHCAHGYLTVGIGHRLDHAKSYYSHKDIESFFRQDLAKAISAARRNFLSFEAQPKRVKQVLVSLCFNLGPEGIARFRRFRSAIDRGDCAASIRELRDSLWRRQLPGRCAKYCRILEVTKLKLAKK